MILTNVYAKCADCLQQGKDEKIVSLGGITLKRDPHLFNAIVASGHLYFECTGHHDRFRSTQINHGRFLIFRSEDNIQLGWMGASLAGVDSMFWPENEMIKSELLRYLVAEGPRGERWY